jgi:PIN domain nuclease of toxin-antitoxin system
VLLWVADGRLASSTKADITAAQDVYVSAVSIWEVEIKRATGKLTAPENLARRVDAAGYDRLAITFEHATESGRLAPLHGDPFDRMLIAQARVEGLTLVTADPEIARYPVVVLDATRR